MAPRLVETQGQGAGRLAAAADASQMRDFQGQASTAAGCNLSTYGDLHRWACAHGGRFWPFLLQWCDLEAAGSPGPAVTSKDVETARFFPGLRLNYARNLLRPLEGIPDDEPAILWRSDSGRERQISRAELRDDAMAVAGFLRSRGIRAGDRVVAFAANTIECATACLGATSIGAVWSSVSPEIAPEAVLSRFSQLLPSVLIASVEQVAQGTRRELSAQVRQIAEGLPSLNLLILLGGQEGTCMFAGPPSATFEEVLCSERADFDNLDLFPFDHPLFILFSSGTTGAPKCIVHGAGGTLLEHVKEHRLHVDLRHGDRLCFITSTGWMMWNWQLSALASGVTLILYDGSVLFPTARYFWDELDQCGVSVLGLSPAYVQSLKQLGFAPREHAALTALRAIESTGSVLYDEQFDWLTRSVKDVPVHTISGGTDLIGCFVLGNPLLPVVPGEAQCISLGLDVRVAGPDGVADHGIGELVCVNPFPSRPVGFWGDAGGYAYHNSYFVQNPGIWTHGDRIEISRAGGVRVLGRSDGTLNVRGVRIGPAEIYSVVLANAEVREALAVGLEDRAVPGGQRIVLLLVADCAEESAGELKRRIRRELAAKRSPVHVPDYILLVSDLPRTLNGKLSERAARDAINGHAIANAGALQNPQILDEISAKGRQILRGSNPMDPTSKLAPVHAVEAAGSGS